MLDRFDVYKVAREFYWLCKELKLERFLRDQILRASSSIALNIAEGSGKRTADDQARYYSIALGSLRECQAILDLERIDSAGIRSCSDRLGAMLFKLSRLKGRRQTERERKQKRQTGPDPEIRD